MTPERSKLRRGGGPWDVGCFIEPAWFTGAIPVCLSRPHASRENDRLILRCVQGLCRQHRGGRRAWLMTPPPMCAKFVRVCRSTSLGESREELWTLRGDRAVLQLTILGLPSAERYAQVRFCLVGRGKRGAGAHQVVRVDALDA